MQGLPIRKGVFARVLLAKGNDKWLIETDVEYETRQLVITDNHQEAARFPFGKWASAAAWVRDRIAVIAKDGYAIQTQTLTNVDVLHSVR